MCIRDRVTNIGITFLFEVDHLGIEAPVGIASLLGLILNESPSNAENTVQLLVGPEVGIWKFCKFGSLGRNHPEAAILSVAGGSCDSIWNDYGVLRGREMH